MEQVTNTEDKAFLSSMQNDRIASTAGKDIKTYKLEMRHRREAPVRLEQAEEIKKK